MGSWSDLYLAGVVCAKYRVQVRAALHIDWRQINPVRVPRFYATVNGEMLVIALSVL